MPVATKRSPLRDGLFGFTDDHDRLYLLHTPGGAVFAITEYNDELTGFSPQLHELDPKIFHYGGNAYYITGTWARQNNYRVEEIEDRK